MAEHLSVVMPVYNERYLVAECVRRVLNVDSPLIRQLDLIVVDDGSTDGTRDVLRALASEHADRITYIEHEHNSGKGAAVRTGIAHARGSVTVIQDADLEYDPRDLPRLILPFVQGGADAVFGSRFLTSEYRRALYYRHRLGNHLLTAISNLLTDIDLTDMETCYKAVRTELLRSIPIRSNDFRLEVELTFKLAKRTARIFEVPISYAGRTYEEGKKIGFKDAVRALGAMFHWWLVDDIYKPDEYSSNILIGMAGAPHFNRWLGDMVRPFAGARVLELGAGIGNLTRTLLPRDAYTVSDVNPHYLAYLRNFAEAKPYIDVRRIDLTSGDDFAPLKGRYDTVICLNVLEHVPDGAAVLRHACSALEPGGRAIILVSQDPQLYCGLDEVLGHVRRYTRAQLRAAIEAAGLEVERMLDFNRATRPAWWLNGHLLRRRRFSKIQLKAVNIFAWLMRLLDHVLPWPGASLIAVARRPVESRSTHASKEHLQAAGTEQTAAMSAAGDSR
jgi:glycosyltransferase involved in cell wall biosynthesis